MLNSVLTLQLKLLRPPCLNKRSLISISRGLATHSNTTPRVLITGGLGQLGLHLARQLRGVYGKESVILTDVSKPPPHVREDGPFKYLDVCDADSMHRLVVANDVNWIIHYAALLSAVGENNVPLATKVNIQGVTNVLEVSRTHNLKVFIPSTIGAFGPDSPLHNTPDVTIQRPRTIYGVSKVYAELLGEYFHHRFKTDFRSLRFPGIVSANVYSGAGTTDYAAQIFHKCISEGEFTCNLEPDTALPMMYIDDCSKSVIDFLHTPDHALKLRTYNVTSMSFTPSQLEHEVKTRLPNAVVKYEVESARQRIAESWPRSLDDSNARHDWNWKPKFDIGKMSDEMVKILTKKYQKGTHKPN